MDHVGLCEKCLRRACDLQPHRDGGTEHSGVPARDDQPAAYHRIEPRREILIVHGGIAKRTHDGGMTESATIGRKPTLAYALGGLGTGIINSVPTILLLFFETEVLHITGGPAELIILL